MSTTRRSCQQIFKDAILSFSARAQDLLVDLKYWLINTSYNFWCSCIWLVCYSWAWVEWFGRFVWRRVIWFTTVGAALAGNSFMDMIDRFREKFQKSQYLSLYFDCIGRLSMSCLPLLERSLVDLALETSWCLWRRDRVRNDRFSLRVCFEGFRSSSLCLWWVS